MGKQSLDLGNKIRTEFPVVIRVHRARLRRCDHPERPSLFVPQVRLHHDRDTPEPALPHDGKGEPRARANDATDGRDESELGGGGGEKRGNEGFTSRQKVMSRF